jgi:transposase
MWKQKFQTLPHHQERNKQYKIKLDNYRYYVYTIENLISLCISINLISKDKIFILSRHNNLHEINLTVLGVKRDKAYNMQMHFAIENAG